MPALVRKMPVNTGYNLVHPVGKLETAVLDMDPGLAVRQIGTVNIGVSRHID